MHNFWKFFRPTLFGVIIILLQWSGNQSLPLHALNSERCYSHMYLTQQQIQNKLWCLQPFNFPYSTFIHCQLSLSGIIIPEVFPLLSLHIKMSNTPKRNYLKCQAHVSLETRLLGPNHFSPQGWQKCKVRGRFVFQGWQQKRKNIPPWKITLSMPSQPQPGITRALKAVQQHCYKTRYSISSILG